MAEKRPGLEPASGTLERSREQREALRDAMSGLEPLIAARAIDRESEWAAEAREQLAVVERAFESHVKETEAPGGLHADLMARAPRLRHRVEMLRDEHEDLTRELERIGRALRALEEGRQTDIGRCRDRALRLLHDLSRHRQLGADLVYEAYYRDIGAND